MAAVCYALLFVATSVIARVALNEMVGANLLSRKSLNRTSTLGILMLIVFFVPYLPSRLIFARLRWRRILWDGSYCLRCGYNLTGNVSGICPECGEPI